MNLIQFFLVFFNYFVIFKIGIKKLVYITEDQNFKKLKIEGAKTVSKPSF
jgi:hypothetical protein